MLDDFCEFSLPLEWAWCEHRSIQEPLFLVNVEDIRKLGKISIDN